MQHEQGVLLYTAALRLCGTIESHSFAQATCGWFKEFIPLESVLLTTSSPAGTQLMAIARATEDGGQTLELRVDASPEIKKQLGTLAAPVAIAPRASSCVPAKPWIEHGLMKGDVSLISLRTIVSAELVAIVYFLAPGGSNYTEEHLAIVAELREVMGAGLKNCFQLNRVREAKRRLAEDNTFLQKDLRKRYGSVVVGGDFGLRQVMEEVYQIAAADSSALVTGERGTGKHLLASTIHAISIRRNEIFLTFNCGSVPENLLEQELFGIDNQGQRGAPKRVRGRIERAAGGTLVLEEVDRLPPELQKKMCNVITKGWLQRLGSREKVTTNVRIIGTVSSTSPDVFSMKKNEKGLVALLAESWVDVPPLRERKGDIASLAQHFILHYARQFGLQTIPALSTGSLERFKAYDWPGNVRELQGLIERALFGPPKKRLSLEPVAGKVQMKPVVTATDNTDDPLHIDKVMVQHILKVMELAGGKVGGANGAAQMMGINPSTLRKRMRKLGIPYGRQASYSSPLKN